jgi:hypothetical protein
MAVFKACYLIYKMDIIKLQTYGIILEANVIEWIWRDNLYLQQISMRNTNNKKDKGKLRKTGI